MATKHERLIEMIESGYDISVSGKENIPDGPTLYVANHNGMMDIFFLPASLPSPVAMLISSRLAFKPGDRQDFIKEYIDCYPLEVHAGKEYSALSLAIATNALIRGENIGMFPEGVYTGEGVVHKSHTGMARILFDALENGVYVNLVPVAIDYKPSGDLDYYGESSQDRVCVHILSGIDYRDIYESYADSKDFEVRNVLLHKVVDEAMSSIADYLGIEYTSEYIELYKKKTIFLPDGSEVPIEEVPEIQDYILLLKKHG